MMSTAVFCIYYYRQFNFMAFKNYLLSFSTPGSYFVCFYTQLMISAPILVISFIAFNSQKGIQFLMLCFFSLLGVVLNYYSVIGDLYLGANYVLGGTYLEVFCIGIFIMLNIEYLNKKIIKIISLLIAVIYLVVFFTNNYYENAWTNPPNQIAISYSLAVFIVLYCLLDFLNLLPLNKKKIDVFIRPITILGENSLWIFLFHFIVITILQEKTQILSFSTGWVKFIRFARKFIIFFIGALYIPLILKCIVNIAYNKWVSIILVKLRKAGYLQEEYRKTG